MNALSLVVEATVFAVLFSAMVTTLRSLVRWCLGTGVKKETPSKTRYRMPPVFNNVNAEVEWTFKVRISEKECEALIGKRPVTTKVYWDEGTRGPILGPFEHKEVLYKKNGRAPNKSQASYKVSVETLGVQALDTDPDQIKHFAVLEHEALLVGPNEATLIKRMIVSSVIKRHKFKPTYWIEIEYETNEKMTQPVVDYVLQDIQTVKSMECGLDLFTSFIKEERKGI